MERAKSIDRGEVTSVGDVGNLAEVCIKGDAEPSRCFQTSDSRLKQSVQDLDSGACVEVEYERGLLFSVAASGECPSE
jgi:hypothetical protein